MVYNIQPTASGLSLLPSGAAGHSRQQFLMSHVPEEWIIQPRAAAWPLAVLCLQLHSKSSGPLPSLVLVHSQYQLYVWHWGKGKIPSNPLKQLKGWQDRGSFHFLSLPFLSLSVSLFLSTFDKHLTAIRATTVAPFKLSAASSSQLSPADLPNHLALSGTTEHVKGYYCTLF